MIAGCLRAIVIGEGKKRGRERGKRKWKRGERDGRGEEEREGRDSFTQDDRTLVQ